MPAVELPALGEVAPDFTLTDVDGVRRSLSEYRGKKVMLSFYRHASCPMCNYAVDGLRGRMKKLAWAARLDVIAVFQSPAESVKEFLLRKRGLAREEDAGARAQRSAEFPLLLLADPEMTTYDMYNCGRTGCRGLLRGIYAQMSNRYDKYKYGPWWRNHDQRIEGFWDRLPADFLIDEDGVVVEHFRARNWSEHIPLDRIDRFLLPKDKR